ncbi:MAG: DUF5723 family protein, partial [Bacteroidota bacterium]
MHQLHTDSTVRVGFRGEYFLNSNALDNDFVLGFLGNRDFIDRPTKDRISQRLDDRNRIGGEVNYGFHASFPLKKLLGDTLQGWNWFVRLADRQHVDLRFPKDFFDLGFYGNRRFAGDTADLGDFFFNFIGYQQLQAGLLLKHASGHRLGWGVSLLKGERQLTVDAPEVNFFTSELGDRIEVLTRGEVQQSDTGNTSRTAFNGLGTSVDLYYGRDFSIGSSAVPNGTVRL